MADQRHQTNAIISTLGCIGALLLVILVVSVVGVITIGPVAWGIANVTRYYGSADDTRLPSRGSAKAEPSKADAAIPENCRPEAECPRAVITVYRSDQESFRDYLEQAFIRYGGTYTVDRYGTYYALLPPEPVRELLDLSVAPKQNGVTAGYGEWAKRAVAQPVAKPPGNPHGIYVTVYDHCSHCLNGWALIVVGVFITGLIIWGIVAGAKGEFDKPS